MLLKWPANLSVEKFLSDYWQKQPCLLRNAFDLSEDLITPDELGGMACEEGIESRLIIGTADNTQWSVEHGPLKEERFNALPDQHWTVLVQDVDKYLPQAAALVDEFRFLPSWRIDDLMISYAEDQGSVGPHTDSYDVFLVQLQGERLWKISDKPYTDSDLISDIEIRVLKHFEQTDEWLLHPGDMLYLPPDIAHWGIAQGACMTGSVGFISPTQEQLFNAWADFNAENLIANNLYQDAGITITGHPEEIDNEAIRRISDFLKQAIDTSPDVIRQMFGQLVSETKPSLIDTMHVPGHKTSETELVSKLAVTDFFPHPGLRMYYSITADRNRLLLFFNGESVELSTELLPFVQLLCENNQYHPGTFDQWKENPAALKLLCKLINQGYVVEDS